MLALSDVKVVKIARRIFPNSAGGLETSERQKLQRNVMSALALGFVLTFPISAQAGGASSHPGIYRNLVNLCVKLEKKPRSVCKARVRKNMAHMKPPLRGGFYWAGGTGSGHGAVKFVELMNRQGNTAVFGRSCSSSCAIIWQLARRKCLLHGGQVALQQHKQTGRGETVNDHSKDPNYWRGITRGKQAPSWGLTYYEGRAPKCPDGIQIAGYRSERGHSRSADSTPSIFKGRWQ